MRRSDATDRPPLSGALAAALNLLRGRDYFSTELQRALRRKDFPEEDIDYALEVARKRNFINDDSLARRVASHLDFKKHYGPERIRAELMKRHAPEETIDRTVTALKPEHETIRYSLADLRKRGAFTPAQLGRRLSSRGYSEDAIRGVLEEIASD